MVDGKLCHRGERNAFFVIGGNQRLLFELFSLVLVFFTGSDYFSTRNCVKRNRNLRSRLLHPEPFSLLPSSQAKIQTSGRWTLMMSKTFLRKSFDPASCLGNSTSFSSQITIENSWYPHTWDCLSLRPGRTKRKEFVKHVKYDGKSAAPDSTHHYMSFFFLRNF